MSDNNSIQQIKPALLAKLRCYNASCPVLSASLEESFSVSGAQIRDAVRELRREGHPIANSKHGYYYARSYTEIEPTLADLSSRALSMLQTVKLIKENFFPARQDQNNLFNQ